MLKRIMLVSLVSICMLMIFRSESKAQYNYFGGGWEFCFLDENFNFVCSYHHTMTFTGVKGSDFKTFEIFLLSKAVWYDNIKSCCVGNNCKNEPFNPGGGHVTTEGTVQLNLADDCSKQGKCTGVVVYPNKVSEMPAFGCTGDLLQCFQDFLNLTVEDITCRNKNDRVVAIFTKGVCATATAQTCDVDNPENCTDKREVGLRYTFPSFNQQPGDAFAQQRDDRCIACVDGTGQCEP
jgi:hypothetical protein